MVNWKLYDRQKAEGNWKVNRKVTRKKADWFSV